jgi:hypothetical protein
MGTIPRAIPARAFPTDSREQDLTNLCSRHVYFMALPAVAIAACSLVSACIPAKYSVFDRIFRPVRWHDIPTTELPGHENSPAALEGSAKEVPPWWKTALLSGGSLLLACLWFATVASAVTSSSTSEWKFVTAIAMGSCWLFSSILPLVRPSATPTYSLFLLHAILFTVTSFDIIDSLSTSLPLSVLRLSYVQTIVAFALTVVSLSMPLNTVMGPYSLYADARCPSKEDYTTLWGWLTFQWVAPLLAAARARTLEKEDVWVLSPLNQSKHVHRRFAEERTKRRSLLLSIILFNLGDMLIDFSLSFVSVVYVTSGEFKVDVPANHILRFEYASLFFMKVILDSIEQPGSISRDAAIVYALAAFLCSMLKGQSDLQHLYFGRRASIRGKLASTVYLFDKALKRRDLSGIASKKVDEDASEEERKKAEKNAGADIGKVFHFPPSQTSIDDSYPADYKLAILRL